MGRCQWGAAMVGAVLGAMVGAGCQRHANALPDPVLPAPPIDQAMLQRDWQPVSALYADTSVVAGNTGFLIMPRWYQPEWVYPFIDTPIFLANVVMMPYSFFRIPAWKPVEYRSVTLEPTYTAMPPLPPPVAEAPTEARQMEAPTIPPPPVESAPVVAPPGEAAPPAEVAPPVEFPKQTLPGDETTRPAATSPSSAAPHSASPTPTAPMPAAPTPTAASPTDRPMSTAPGIEMAPISVTPTPAPTASTPSPRTSPPASPPASPPVVTTTPPATRPSSPAPAAAPKPAPSPSTAPASGRDAIIVPTTQGGYIIVPATNPSMNK